MSAAEMVTVAQYMALAAERDGLRSAMKCDDDRLRAASEKVGRPPMGCDTADDLADTILGLRAQRGALIVALRDLIDAASRVPVDREWSPLLTSSLTCARTTLWREGAS